MAAKGGSSPLVAVSEYLATSYRPDRDYVDGELHERNLGEWPHSRAQATLCAFLFQGKRGGEFASLPNSACR